MGSGVGKTIRRLSSRIKVEPCENADSVSPTSPSSSVSPKGSLANGESPGGDITKKSSTAMGKPFPKRPMGSKLSQNAWDRLEQIFHRMDPDGSDAVTKEEARQFFKGAFGKLSADAMFNEVDVDGSGAITAEEFISFWTHVAKSGYKESDILDELDELLEGGAWVDWKDGRETGNEKDKRFPSRPILCRLSAKTWKKCEDLFKKIDKEGDLYIDKEKATRHFVGTFTKVSVDAMFNEIDPRHHGQIPAKEWMKFWVQVKTSGYKEVDIAAELDNLLEGGTWVDWKDGRSTA